MKEGNSIKCLRKLAAICLAALLFAGTQVSAVTNNVSTIAALQTAINGASAGDVIVLANGTYLNSILDVSKDGITVRAATSGGVFLNGSNEILITGDRTTFSGFQFTSGTMSVGWPIEVRGNQNLINAAEF